MLEAPTSSIFWVAQDGALCTPPLDEHILASITRDRLIEAARRRGARGHARRTCWRPREAFLASTTREVQPIAAIEDRDLGEPGERTRDAAARFSRALEQELGAAG